MARRRSLTQAELIQKKLDEIHSDLKEVRETDIPNLKIEVAVMKEKSNTSAKLISAVGGIVAVVVSTAIAFVR